MKKTLFSIFWLLLIVFMHCLPYASAQDYTQWSLPDGAKLRLGKGDIEDMQYSPNGTMLAISGSIGIWLYDAQTLQEIALLTEKKELNVRTYNSIAFSPNGETLVSACNSARFGMGIRLWDVPDKKIRKKYQKNVSAYYYIVLYSPDGNTITGVSYNKIQFWDAQSGTEKETEIEHQDGFSCMTFSPNSKTIATGNKTGEIHLWDVNTGKEKQKLTGHKKKVFSVAFSPDGKTVASGSEDHTIRFWNAEIGKQMSILKGHTGSVYSISFSPNGKTIASGSNDKTIRLWDTTTAKQMKLLNFEDHVGHVAFSPDGKTLASANSHHIIRLWDVKSGKQINLTKGHGHYVRGIFYSPDGKTIASTSTDNTIRLWDAGTGRHKKDLTNQRLFDPQTKRNFYVENIAFSPDGKKLVSSTGILAKDAYLTDDFGEKNGKKDIYLWDTETGKLVKILKKYIGYVESVAFSPDGKILATGGANNTIYFWDMTTLNHAKTLTGHTEPVTSLSFSPNGKLLASGSQNGSIRIWNATSGEFRQTLTGHTHEIDNLSFSLDERTLASTSQDNTLRLWNLDTNEQEHALTGIYQTDWNVMFTPNGKTLACESNPHGMIPSLFKSIRLWDVVNGEQMKIYRGAFTILDVIFSPNGSTIGSGGLDSTILLWDISSINNTPKRK